MMVEFLNWLTERSSSWSIPTIFDFNEKPGELQLYILAWLLGLVLLLDLGPRSGNWALVIVGVAFYRLQDLVFASLDDGLKLTGRGKKWAAYLWNTAEFPIVMGLSNILEIILIFAIAYQNLAGPGKNVFLPPSVHAAGISTPFDFLYLSWTSLFTLGSGYVPATTMARALVMTEAGAGLLIIGITLACFIARLGKNGAK